MCASISLAPAKWTDPPQQGVLLHYEVKNQRGLTHAHGHTPASARWVVRCATVGGDQVVREVNVLDLARANGQCDH
jgi:hypothetical protein